MPLYVDNVTECQDCDGSGTTTGLDGTPVGDCQFCNGEGEIVVSKQKWTRGKLNRLKEALGL